MIIKVLVFWHLVLVIDIEWYVRLVYYKNKEIKK